MKSFQRLYEAVKYYNKIKLFCYYFTRKSPNKTDHIQLLYLLPAIPKINKWNKVQVSLFPATHFTCRTIQW